MNFSVDDVEDVWLHKDHFDLIHTRHTVMAIKDWPKLMGQALAHLKPGGWFECQEVLHLPESYDGTMTPDNPMYTYWSLIHAALQALGVDFHATLKLEQMMRDAGFVNVQRHEYHIPIGTWPRNKALKMVGLYWRTILTNGLEAIAMATLTRGLNWTYEQVRALLAETEKAYVDTMRVHADMRLFIVYGQRPY